MYYIYTFLSNMEDWKLSGEIIYSGLWFAVKASRFILLLHSHITALKSLNRENAPGVQFGSQKCFPWGNHHLVVMNVTRRRKKGFCLFVCFQSFKLQNTVVTLKLEVFAVNKAKQTNGKSTLLRMGLIKTGVFEKGIWLLGKAIKSLTHVIK